ncbi:MAG: hypothetical protein GWP08_12915 [Nitrospiraceae bacterium]|nr:hypothetical protein [Nitrospiraceae bacterium]
MVSDVGCESQRQVPVGLVFALTGLLFVGFLGSVYAFAWRGETWVDSLPDRIGEVHMDRGARYERAGEFAAAIDIYKQALQARFQSPGNRRATLRRIGRLVRSREGWEAALPYLREACRLSADPVSDYAALHARLLKAGQAGVALEIAQEWSVVAEELGSAAEQARAKRAATPAP